MAISRAARQKDKTRKRQQRLQIMESFTYQPVDCLWKNEKIAELQIPPIHFASTGNSTPLPLTTPVAFRKIIGDGNCFFRCLSYIITGGEDNHRVIRQQICAYMERHSDIMKSHITNTTNNSLRNYLESTHMEQDNIWATEVEIFAASMLLRTNIYIYTKHGVHWTWTRHTSQFTNTDKGIYLFHKDLNHFEVVIAVDNSVIPVSILNDSEYYVLKQSKKYLSFEHRLNSSLPKKKPDVKTKEKRNFEYQNKYKSNEQFRNKLKNDRYSKYRTDNVFRKKKSEGLKRYQKQKYKTDLRFKRKKQRSSRLRQRLNYTADPLFAQAKKEASRLYYRTRTQYRIQKKYLLMLKYSTNLMFRSRVISLSKQRYSQNKSHRVKVKQRSSNKYAYNVAHREKMKQSSKKKYANDLLHREKVKQFSRGKYAKNAVQRQKVRLYSKVKYQRFASFRNNVKASSIKKYASSPLFRSCIKQHLHTQYHSLKSVREKKKTKVFVSRQSIIKAVQKFKNNVTNAPKYICTVCIRILYRSQVKICNRNRYTSDGELNKSAEECLTGLYVHHCDNNCKEDCMMKDSERDKEWICHNCDRYMKNDSMPPQSMANNLLLPEIPEVLAKLNVLERQLIALRIPFMKLLSLPRGGQKGVKGPVVSVPTDLNTVCTSLPRNFSDSQLIKVKLKRKLEYKGHYTYKWINPSNVLEALQDLLQHNCWYDNIHLDKSWIENISESGLTEPGMEVDDSDSEEETPQQTEPCHTIPVDSCFQPIDIGQEMLDNNNTLCLAPAEHQKPQNIFQEDGADAMAFPVLLPDGRYGLFENRKIKLSPAKYFNARLFSADTRFSTDKEFIFYAQYVTEINYISSNISLALRKGKPTTTEGKKVTASMILDSEHSNEILKSDIGYRFLQPVRGTPPYWQRTMKDLYAMLRQLGIPTWFVTFSAAEMRWEEVTKTLLYLNNDSRPVADVEWSERAKLVSDNPVMCARMFDHRVKALFTDLLMSPSCPVGKVVDYFYRTEFQQRGSPHIHCLLWIEDAPRFNENTDKEVCQFIDNYVTCKMPDETLDPELFEIISSVQVHSKNHSKSCKKYSSTCRFNFPRPPVYHTFIARADSDKEEQDIATLTKPTVEELDQMSKQSARTPKQILRDLWILLSNAEETHLTFPEILQLADVTYQEYQQCLKDIATRNTVHIKRQLSDIWVNNYNPHLSRAWDANLDIQFVTDAYACVAYIISYISKAETEMGDLLQNAKEEADEGNADATEAMRKIANVYLQNREVSSQEAVYRVCGLHLKQCTRDVIFIPAGNNIQKMSLPISIIKARTSQGEDEEDIWMSSLHDKYYARPDSEIFNNMSLAEFCSKHRILSKSHRPKSTKSSNSLPVYELQKGLGYIQQRKPNKEAVIRYPRFVITKNPEDYFLSLIQLFLPHRSPITLTPPMTNYEEFVRTGQVNGQMVHAIIEENRHHFEKDSDTLEKAWQDLQEGKVQEDAWAYIAPESEVERIETIMEKQPETENEKEDIPELNYNQNQDTEPKRHTFEYQAPKIPTKVIQEALRNMNTTQQQVFYKVRNWCLQYLTNQQPDPFHVFVTGGAGTGKSHLIKCIYSEATRILSKCSITPDSSSVLLTAPTGTAAFNIQGLTIHSAFAINKDIKLPYQPLGESILNTLRNKFESLKLLIIDEISMVDQKILTYIHGRLAQIRHSKTPFGGMSIIAVGDFYQLPPVRGLSLYKIRESNFLDLWNTMFSKVTLTEVMRQKEDKFAAMLNRLRSHIKGNPFQPEDKTTLSNLSFDDTPEHAKDFLHIFPTNKEVDKHNEQMVNRKCNPVFSSLAKDFYRDIVTGKVCQRETPFASRTAEDLQTVVKIGVGARIMLTRNLDTDDGLVNGAFGTITAIDHSSTTSICAVYVKFDNPKIGLKFKKKSVVHISKRDSVRIKPIDEILRGKQITRKQFPFKLGWGATIHKVQGMTVTNIVISMKKIFQAGMAYVALSRATSMTGLHILDFDENTIYSSEDITTAIEKMPSFLPPSTTEPTFNSTSSVQIIHHNTEGILPHLADIRQNKALQECPIICLTETWLNSKTKLPASLLSEYTAHSLLRKDAYESHRPEFNRLSQTERGGVTMFIRQTIDHTRFQLNTTNIEAVACILKEPDDLIVVTIYRPPVYPVTIFKRTISQLLTEIQLINIPTVVSGDFNENVLNPENNQILQLFNEFGYQQLIDQPTTESGTCLDLLFVKGLSKQTVGMVVPTYYSFHDAVKMFIPV